MADWQKKDKDKVIHVNTSAVSMNFFCFHLVIYYFYVAGWAESCLILQAERVCQGKEALV